MTVGPAASHRVAVVGGGVLGAAIAAAVADDGATVAVFTEDDGRSTAATTASFAWVNARDKAPESYQRLNEDARRRHQELARPWFHAVGASADGVEYPGDGYVDTDAFVASHLDAARAAGAVVHPRATVDALDELRDRFDTVVVAAGTGTAASVAGLPHAARRIDGSTDRRAMTGSSQGSPPSVIPSTASFRSTDCNCDRTVPESSPRRASRSSEICASGRSRHPSTRSGPRCAARSWTSSTGSSPRMPLSASITRRARMVRTVSPSWAGWTTASTSSSRTAASPSLPCSPNSSRATCAVTRTPDWLPSARERLDDTVTDLQTDFSSLLAGLPARQGFGDATLIRLAPGSIDLGGGNPSTDLLPIDLYRDAARDVTTGDEFAPLLRYSPAPGLPSLRQTIAERDGVSPDRVLLSNGGAHGLALAVLGLVDPGDTIVVDDPVYPLFLRVLDLIGDVEVVPVSVGRDGIDVDELRTKLVAGLRPKALFTVPTFQNPSGVTLSEEKSDALVDLAEQYGFTIISDDPYREIAFPGTHVPERARFRDTDRVVAVNSFSKTLGPGLRLGWIVVPDGTSEQFTRLRNRLDGQSSGILQAIVERMLRTPGFDASIAAAGAGYADKARVLTRALRDEFGDDVELAEPTGGFFVWAHLGGDIDFERLFDDAQTLGVTYQRGEWFGAGGEEHRGLVRLSFSEPSDADLREGVARLASAWRTLRS